MAAKGDHVDFMFLAPSYPAAGSATAIARILTIISTEKFSVSLNVNGRCDIFQWRIQESREEVQPQILGRKPNILAIFPETPSN